MPEQALQWKIKFIKMEDPVRLIFALTLVALINFSSLFVIFKFISVCSQKLLPPVKRFFPGLSQVARLMVLSCDLPGA